MYAYQGADEAPCVCMCVYVCVCVCVYIGVSALRRRSLLN